MRDFSSWLMSKKAFFADKPFDDSALSKQFIRHWELAPYRRIKVQLSYGETVWGYVGVTSGWKPSFLLLRRLGQNGSSILLSDKEVILEYKTNR